MLPLLGLEFGHSGNEIAVLGPQLRVSIDGGLELPLVVLPLRDLHGIMEALHDPR